MQPCSEVQHCVCCVLTNLPICLAEEILRDDVCAAIGGDSGRDFNFSWDVDTDGWMHSVVVFISQPGTGLILI